MPCPVSLTRCVCQVYFYPENCPQAAGIPYDGVNPNSPVNTGSWDWYINQRLWNYWGYNANGLALSRAQSRYYAFRGYAQNSLCGPSPGNPPNGFPGRWSYFPALANPMAPDNTIITHCVFHRPTWGRWTGTAWDPSAMDVVLRIDGSAKSVKTESMGALLDPLAAYDPVANPTKWERQVD